MILAQVSKETQEVSQENPWLSLRDYNFPLSKHQQDHGGTRFCEGISEHVHLPKMEYLVVSTYDALQKESNSCMLTNLSQCHNSLYQYYPILPFFASKSSSCCLRHVFAMFDIRSVS